MPRQLDYPYAFERFPVSEETLRPQVEILLRPTYSPSATGNVSTEDVLYALRGSKYRVVVDIGWWINERLGRQCESAKLSR
jgi:hypothetical protein